LNTEGTISTKSTNYASLTGYSIFENSYKENNLKKLESLKKKFEEIHVFKEEISDTESSSLENSIDENDEISIELIIEEDDKIESHKDEFKVSHMIQKMKKLKNVFKNDPIILDFEKLKMFKNEILKKN
jgi:hypothetical protein